MSFADTAILAAIAGFTIFLGLPLARLKNPPRSLQAILNAIATGILLFLLWDILSEAIEPIEDALGAAENGDSSNFVLLLFVFVVGLAVGLLSLVFFEQRFIRRARQQHLDGPGGLAPYQLSLMIAAGIGLHNFSEGLAIGQASRAGEISLATILIVGFALNNMTEGFGISAPLTAGPLPTWGFLGLVGLIGGGPTFLGAMIGYSFLSEPIFVLCLALAAGSILYVISELLNVGRRFQLRELAMAGVLVGFLAGFGTDLILHMAGA
jgi:ZIP family zinc transporter